MKNNKFFSLETTFMFWGCITYPVLVSFYAFLGSVLLQVVSLVIGVSIFSIMFYRKNRISYQQKILLLFVILFLILFGAYAAVWTGMRNYGVILFLLSGIGIAWASLELNITKYVYEYPFYIFLIVTLVLIANGFDRNSFNSLLDAGSRNVYSAILIAFAFGYLLSKTLMRSSPSLILGLLLIFSSFILYSRTGLFLSFIFFIIILLQNKSFIKFKVFILLLSIILAIALGVGDLIKDYSNFSKGLESARYEIWRSYVSDINLVSLFFGSNLNYNELIMEFNGNPHSAFLRMHAYFGFGFLFLMMLIVFSFVQLVIGRYWIHALILLIFLFRAAFDPIYLIWWFDYLFYPSVFFLLFRGYFEPNSYDSKGIKKRV